MDILQLAVGDPSSPSPVPFSGDRGNASQVHQLLGMKGLMLDPQRQWLIYRYKKSYILTNWLF